MGYILGINSSHDPSVCLMKDNVLIAAIEEERLNLDKHSALIKVSTPGSKKAIKLMPFLSINYVLEYAGISIDDLDKIIINDCAMIMNKSIENIEEYLKSIIPIKDKSKIKFLSPSKHHLVHAYNAYYQSNFNESIIIVVDSFSGSDTLKDEDYGVFESIFYAKNNDIKEIYKRERVPGEMGIGALYQFFCKLLNFNVSLSDNNYYNYFKIGFDEAGKLMGLASYGKDVFTETITKIQNGELSIKIKDLYDFGVKYGIVKEILFPNIFDKLYMIPRQDLLQPNKTFTDYTNEVVKNYAYFAQKELEKAMQFLVEKADELVKSNNLCITGGVALNCLANGHLYKKFTNKNIFIPFAPADNGNSIGSCFFAYSELNKLKSTINDDKIEFKNVNPFLGKEYNISRNDIIKAARQNGFDSDTLKVVKLSNKKLAKTVAEFLKKEFIVALIEGGSEFGPRALGHRSIIASPIKKETKDYLNFYIKKREWFRPLAPVLLEEFKNEYFEAKGVDSPYMSMVVQLKKKYSFISAIKNVDESSRIQTIDENYPGVLKDIITEFGSITEIFMLLNTSLNYKGMPILENPLDIFSIYEDIPVDIIIINNYLIYDEEILYNLMNYNSLDEEIKNELGEDMLNSSNFYRATKIFEDLFNLTKNYLYLFKIFKTLFNIDNRNSEIQKLFETLYKNRTSFLKTNNDNNLAADFKVFMGVYQLVYMEENRDQFNLNNIVNENNIKYIGLVFFKILKYSKRKVPKSISSENTKVFLEKLSPYYVNVTLFQKSLYEE